MEHFKLETKELGQENPLDELKSAFETHDEAVKARMNDLEKQLKENQKQTDMIETVFRRPMMGPVDDKDGPTLEQKAFQGFLRRGPDSLPEIERKSLTAGSNTEGGYLVTSQFSREVIKNLVEISPIRQVARVGTMNSSNIIIPKRTGTPTAVWVGETETRTGTQAAYGQASISANESACYVDVSQKLLEDAEISIEQEIAFDLAEEFARLEGAAFVTGNGVNKPYGITTDSDVTQIASGNATAVTADSLITLVYNLASFYRSRSAWLMNGSTLAAIRKLKDGNGNYIWQPSLQAGEPETILGRPVIEATDMPDIGAGLLPIALGDFKQAYRIYDRVEMSLLRDPFTLATTGLVRFHARRRVGADVVKPEAYRLMVVSA